MNNIKRIRLNKNRGWRGLAELIAEDSERKEILKMIFSFSQAVWNDLLKGYIVVQDNDNYIILNFDNVDTLPKPTQQRSVLIKNFQGKIVNSWTYPKDTWTRMSTAEHFYLISHFLSNNNKHTTSDWNCVRN